MSKIKSGLVSEVISNKQFEQKQEQLKNKYDIDKDKEVIIVEKSNVYKFTVNTIFRILKMLLTIILFALACVGALTLVYPDIREAFLIVLEEIWMQLTTYIPFLK